jgi:hypothetical protein
MSPEIRNREKYYGADIDVAANVPEQLRIIASSASSSMFVASCTGPS